MAAHTHTTKVTFSVVVRSILRPGEQIGVAVSTDGVFDPSAIVPMVKRCEDPGSTGVPTPSSPSLVAKEIWETARGIHVPRGIPCKYKYAILSSSGVFSSWEKLPGTIESRDLSPHGKLMAQEDAFGELDDDFIQRQLDENAENTRQTDIQRAAQVVSKLQDSFGSSRKLMIVSYSLPVILRKHPETHAWSATWIEDEVLARTPHSIAEDVQTVWVGCITRECIELSTSEEIKRTKRTHSVCCEQDAEPETAGTSKSASANSSPPKPPKGSVIQKLTAGGVDIQAFQAAEAAGTPTGASVTVRPPAAAHAPDGERFRSASFPEPAADDDTMAVTFTPKDMIEITKVLNGMDAVPIFLPSELHEAYACYFMSVIKPCMHNVLETGAQRFFPYAASLEYLSEGWKRFTEANELIASVIFNLCSAGDVIWVNDYPLWLVPKVLVDRCKSAGIRRPPLLFFWHSPFPTSEIFRTLSVRDDLLEAIIQCDLIGFHTFNYARHFLQSVKRLLGINFQSQRGGNIVLDVDGRDVIVSIAHVGVEAEALDRWMASEQAAVVARYFAERHKGKIVIAGIDTCQRLSGIALKLLAFERLLEENPVYRKNLVLVQRCEHRQALTADARRTSAELRERVERIRNTYGDVIDYEEAASYSPTYRVGLFHQADILLQTPIREGLNMLPLEYVYVRTRWQIQRSKAFAGMSDRDGVPSPAIHLPQDSPAESTSSANAVGQKTPSSNMTPLIMEMTTPAASLSDDHASQLSDAALKAMTTGMPAYYATLAAPPSALTKKNRVSLASVFRPAARTIEGSSPSAVEAANQTSGSPIATSSPQPDSERPDGEPAKSPSTELVVPVDDLPLVAPLPPPPRGGCVMLSEFSTASQILNSNLVVNPWSISTVCREIDKALTMADHERSFRQWRDYKYAIRNPAGGWSRQIVCDVLDAYGTQLERLEAASHLVKVPVTPSSFPGLSNATAPAEGSILAAFKRAKNRLLIIDYGGTIMEREAKETRGVRTDFSIDGYSKHIPAPVVEALAALSQDPSTVIYVVSGLRSAAIDALHVSHLQKVGLAAENGMYVSHPTLLVPHNSQGEKSGGKTGAPDASDIGGALAFEIHEVLGSPPPMRHGEGSAQSLQTIPHSLASGWPTMGLVQPSASSSTGPSSAGRSLARHATTFIPSRKWTMLSPSTGDKLAEWATIKARAVALMNEYQWRVNGSAVREYESLVAWDFRNADAEWAQAQARHLAEDLESFSSDTVKVSIRKSRVEVSLRAMNKGKFVSEILKTMHTEPDFILIAGDDVTDEEMFAAAQLHYHPEVNPADLNKQPSEIRSISGKSLHSPAASPPTAPKLDVPDYVFTVNIGRAENATRAGYRLADVGAMQDLIVAMAETAKPAAT